MGERRELGETGRYGSRLPLEAAPRCYPFGRITAVRTWHNMRIESSNGAPMLAIGFGHPQLEAPQVKDLGSRITSNVAENLTGVVVLVDTKAAAGVTVTQLADYIAMISFAKPDLEADLGKTESILQLFAVEPANRPSGLTEWDQAFLRGLYRISFTPKQQRTSIANRMVGELALPLMLLAQIRSGFGYHAHPATTPSRGSSVSRAGRGAAW